MVPVHILCDQPIYAAAMRRSLEQEGRVRVAGVSRGAPDALEAVAAMDRGVVLLDATMPACADLGWITALRRAAPEIPVLLLFFGAGARYLRAALAHGAAGCVRKDAPLEEVLLAIETVHRGHAYLPWPLEADERVPARKVS